MGRVHVRIVPLAHTMCGNIYDSDYGGTTHYARFVFMLERNTTVYEPILGLSCIDVWKLVFADDAVTITAIICAVVI